MAEFGFFDFDERCEQLKAAGNPLELLTEVIDFEAFRPTLEIVRNKERKNASGRKPYDVVLMFKVLILGSIYNLSDDQLEYQIRDRISFMHFLKLTLSDRVPDAKTIWLFRNELAKLDLVKPLFEQFDHDLDEAGFTAQQGTILDASIVEVPRQRNTREENAQIKAGVIPSSFPDNPCKYRQKDTDAQWLTKNKVSHFGYKNHVGVDVKHKFIRRYEVTDASVHDSQVVDPLLDEKNTNKKVFADSAYRSAAIVDLIESRGYEDNILHKGYRNKPLTPSQKKMNRKRSRTRARVEHVFGRQSQCLGGTLLRCIGIVRARASIGLRNLMYNMDRYARLVT